MITLIKYGITKNLGDYNSERVDAEYQLGEGESAVEAMVKLKAFVHTGKYDEVESAPKKVQEVVETTPKEEPVVSEPIEEPTKEEPKAEKKKVVKKAPKEVTIKDTSKNIKAVMYDRTIKAHTTIVQEIIESVYPNWKTDAVVKPKALEASKSMHGKPFLHLNGTPLESFKTEFLALIG